jgi:hypothetical protein
MVKRRCWHELVKRVDRIKRRTMDKLILKKLILTLLTMLAALGSMYAQNGKVALGFRATPDGGGFTGKFYGNKHMAVEAQLNAGGVFGGEGQSVTLVGLLEHHFYMPDPSWQIFIGGGAHMGVWDHDGRRTWNGDNYYNDYSREGIFGLDAIGGVQYKFKRIPLSLSADMKPAINLVAEPDIFWHNWMGLSARFHIY